METQTSYFSYRIKYFYVFLYCSLAIDLSASENKMTENYLMSCLKCDTLPTIIKPVKPSFPGGREALLDYLGSNMSYPEIAKKHKIEGQVLVKFMIKKDGSITDAFITRGIGGGCDEEALRVVKNMPKWNPGLNNNVPVDALFTMPLTFKLDTEPSQPTELNSSSSTEKNEYEKPTFIGGDKALFQYIGENVRYPRDALKNKIEGKVIVEFVVKKDGSIANPKIKRGIDVDCDREALRVIKYMPKWNPGTVNGEPVDTPYYMPVSFTLERP
jgi:TonB family protein